MKSWDGAAWAAVGGAVNVDPTKIAQMSRLASVAGTPYVAWQEYNASHVDQAHVARWTGSAWATVGGVLDIDPTKHAADPSVVSVGGTPYAVWGDETFGGSQVHVARWTGSAWSLVGDALNPGTTAYDQVPRIAVTGGVPFVAFTEPSGSIDQVRVLRLAVDVLAQQTAATATGAVLTATVRDFGTPLPVAFQHGPDGTLGTQTATVTTPGDGTATVTQTIDGLAPDSSYAWRTVGIDAFGLSALGATTAFSTLAPTAAAPGPTPAAAMPPTPAAPATPRTTIACAAGKPVHGRTKVTCTVALAAGRSGAVSATLRRGSVTVASGAGRLSRGGAKLRLSARKRVKPGRYTLIIKAGKATIATSAVRIGR